MSSRFFIAHYGVSMKKPVVAGDKRLTVREVAEALGYIWQPGLVNHVPGEWEDISPINTLVRKNEK